MACDWLQPFQPFASALITSRIVVTAWQAIDVPKPQQTNISGGYSAAIDPEYDIENVALVPFRVFSGNDNEAGLYYQAMLSFFVVAHCLWALFFGFLGAVLTGCLARERLGEETAARSNPPS
jgi:hypothetical protein